jgi:hypothetical protein
LAVSGSSRARFVARQRFESQIAERMDAGQAAEFAARAEEVDEAIAEGAAGNGYQRALRS